MKETLKHTEAFELFYGMGSERSLQKLSSALHISRQALTNWSRQFNWQDRVQLRDANNAKRLEAKTDTKIVDDKAKMLSIVKYGLNVFSEKLKKGQIEITSIADLDKLVKNALLLQGESTEITKMDLSGLSTDQLQKNLEKLIEKL